VALAGLCWGTYVPMIAFGGKELKNSYAAFLCVGVAYFLIAIVVPLSILGAKSKWPALNVNGVTFALLAGAAGAVGALCVIFATFEFGGDRRFVGPLIFGTAPVINTLVSLIWHPTSEAPFHFRLPADAPGWKLYVGIVLAGLGAALVLYSKEEMEIGKPSAVPPPAAAVNRAEPR
jgi:drug/metabolite transporter (DMT)-like permease